jgi:hypothetical protein
VDIIEDIARDISFLWPFVVGPIVLVWALYGEARDWWRRHKH